MKHRKISFALAAAAVVATPIIFSNNTNAAESVFKDYSTLNSVLSENYAPAKLYYTADTKVTVKKVGRQNEGDPTTGIMLKSTYYYVEPNSSAVILIENSTAKDKDGNAADVIIKADNVHYADYAEDDGATVTDRQFAVSLRASICGSPDKFPAACDGYLGYGTIPLKEGDPIMLMTHAKYAHGDFTIQYIKKGSFKDDTMSGDPVGIRNLTYSAFDIDVYAKSSQIVTYNSLDSEDALVADGAEGFYTRSSSPSKTTFYYNKSSVEDEPHLYEKGGGLAIRDLGTGSYSGNYDGFYYGTSYVGLVSGMQNSSYTVTFNAGHGAGSTLFFGSPAPSDASAPKKYINDNGTLVEENRITTDTKYNYEIVQNIPAIFSSEDDVTTYISLSTKYNNISNNHNFASFVVEDEFDENLIMPEASEIKVFLGDTDVTNKFTVAIDGQKLSVTAKSSILGNASFYGSALHINVPVTTKKAVTTKQIVNKASSSYRFTNESASTVHKKDANEVITTVYHKLTVKHIDKDTGKEIADTVESEHDHGYEYTTEKASNLPKGYQLIETPENAKGTLNADTTVIYYYNAPKNPNTSDNELVPFFVAFGGLISGGAAIFFILSKRR